MYKDIAIAGSYRVELLDSLLDEVDFSQFYKGDIVTSVIRCYIGYFKGDIKNNEFLYEISDYTELACQQLPILYPIISSYELSECEMSLILNLSVIFGCRKTIRIALKCGARQKSFLMTNPVSLESKYMYPINFAYYNGDIETAYLLIKHCKKEISYIRDELGNNIKVITSEFDKNTILVNFLENRIFIRKLVQSLNIKFPYLSADNDAKNSVLRMIIKISNIKRYCK